MLISVGQKKLMRSWNEACETNKDPKSNVLYLLENDDLKEWIFMIRSFPGIEELSDCYFMGSLSFPNEYPFKAPKIMMFTPTGRTTENSSMCISGLSSFHNDTWSPTYTPQKIVYSFISTMYDLDTSGIGWIRISKETLNVIKNKQLYDILKQCDSDDDIVKEILKFFNTTSRNWNFKYKTSLSILFGAIIADQQKL